MVLCSLEMFDNYAVILDMTPGYSNRTKFFMLQLWQRPYPSTSTSTYSHPQSFLTLLQWRFDGSQFNRTPSIVGNARHVKIYLWQEWIGSASWQVKVTGINTSVTIGNTAFLLEIAARLVSLDNSTYREHVTDALSLWLEYWLLFPTSCDIENYHYFLKFWRMVPDWISFQKVKMEYCNKIWFVAPLKLAQHNTESPNDIL